MTPGAHVVVLTGLNELRPMVADSAVEGEFAWDPAVARHRRVHDFPVVWVVPPGGGERTPWPLEDVFIDLGAARAAQAARARCRYCGLPVRRHRAPGGGIWTHGNPAGGTDRGYWLGRRCPDRQTTAEPRRRSDGAAQPL